MTVRTRFAPSPTGYLHIGGARVALFCWLYARKHQGQFILRIEDTDQERSTQESVQAIIDGMSWLELDYDEGPFYQTHRMDRYKEVIQQLMDQGKAYPCYCSKERLEKLREKQMAAKQKPRYDGCCRDRKTAIADLPFVVRFRNPLEGAVRFTDRVYGEIVVNNNELDDLIIARSDGMPTYNLTVVVDDSDMKITHVIRGDDHINNTPRQINILAALGANIPVYAHLPMILGEDGKRLSKRHGAASVMEYRDLGFVPQAVLNYLVRLGWSHGDKEIFSKAEMIDLFNLDNINKGAAALNREKLLWLNQHYLKTDNSAELSRAFAWHLSSQGIDYSKGPSLSAVINAQAERCKTLVEMAEKSRYFFEESIEHDPTAVKKNFNPSLVEPFQVFKDKLEKIIDWNAEAIHHQLIDTALQFDLKLGQLAQPIRVAVTGNTVSPPIDVTIFLIGREKATGRISQAIRLLS
jgi:glutamyl-tRNA synthetase